MPKLVIERPDNPPVTFEITEHSVTIGRDPANAIHLDEAACSRRHCQILKIASGYEVTDLKSRNGTKVNGVGKDRAVLSHGDVIEIGATKLRFLLKEEAPRAVAGEHVGVCRLVFTSGPRKGEVVPLATDRTTIGRKESNTIAIDDTMASSYHCEVTKEAGGFVLRDLGSTNGSVVNGDPVSEVALNHGARIRLGKTTFVFMDPAVADYEQTLAAQEEAEAEWGLMREQMDFDRVKRARRASLVWVVIFLLILGGAGAFFAMKPDVAKGLLGVEEVAGVREEAQNRVDDFSFESGAALWQVEGEKTGSATVSQGPARQGQAALQVIGPSEGFVPTVVTWERMLNVSAGTRYEISAWVKPGAPGTAATVGVKWYLPEKARGETDVVRSAIAPFGGPGEFNQVKAIVTPPPGAQRAQVFLLVAGGGSARFDDVVFRETGEQAVAGTVKFRCPGYDMTLCAQGAVAVQKAGEFLLWNGGPVAYGADGALAATETCFRIDRQSGSETEARVEGRLLVPGGSEVPVTLAFAMTGDRLTVEYEVKAPGETGATGFGFTVARGYLAEGASVSGDEMAAGLAADSDESGVKKVIIGALSRRLILSSDEAFRLRLDTSRGLRLLFLAPAGSGPKKLEIIYDFTAMQQDAGRLVQQARAARGAGNLGEAIDLYARVLQEFPFDEVALGQASQEIAALKTDGATRLEKARSTFAAARDFFDVADLSEARKEAVRLSESFTGYPAVADDAADLVRQIDEALGRFSEQGRRSAAEGLLARAKDFKSSGQKALAVVFLELVVSRYEGTEPAKEAAAALKELKEGLESR
ncbi:MAG: FHA domain-containing protein [Planctomycetes bacterium]|nr:FHA domain-containing protein [Planctomycetota bacterium]